MVSSRCCSLTHPNPSPAALRLCMNGACVPAHEMTAWQSVPACAVHGLGWAHRCDRGRLLDRPHSMHPRPSDSGRTAERAGLVTWTALLAHAGAAAHQEPPQQPSGQDERFQRAAVQQGPHHHGLGCVQCEGASLSLGSTPSYKALAQAQARSCTCTPPDVHAWSARRSRGAPPRRLGWAALAM